MPITTRRIESAVTLADAVIVNSAITRDTLLPHLRATGRETPVLVAPFGTDLPRLPELPEPESPPAERPYSAEKFEVFTWNSRIAAWLIT